MVLYAHIINIHLVVHKSLLFRNEEKLVALLVYSSFIRVATSGFRITPYSLVVVFVLRNEEKLVEILVYSSFRRVATSGFRNVSVATSSWGKLSSNEEWFRNHSIFTTALQHNIAIRMIVMSRLWCHQTSSDGTRTEQTFTLGVFHALLQ